MFWGNTSSGLLYCSGRNFGKTKVGQYFQNAPTGQKVTPTSKTKVWRISVRGGCK